MCVYFCGGSCVEDVTTHLMKHLSLHPTLRTCSADTILRAIEELTVDNTSYTSASGKQYDFNTEETMNKLLVNALLAGRLKANQEYDFDFAGPILRFSYLFIINQFAISGTSKTNSEQQTSNVFEKFRPSSVLLLFH